MNNIDVFNNNTEAFIDFNSFDVRLQRKKKVTVAGGGFKWVVDRTLPPQKARLVMRNSPSNANSRVSPDGAVILNEASLIMPIGSDVKVKDEFDYEGEGWEVSRVVTRMSTEAEVFRSG
jgi:hypothetical protein